MDNLSEVLGMLRIIIGIGVAAILLSLLQIGMNLLIYRRLLTLLGSIHSAVLLVRRGGTSIETHKDIDTAVVSDLAERVTTLTDKVTKSGSGVKNLKQLEDLAHDTNVVVHDIHETVKK